MNIVDRQNVMRDKSAYFSEEEIDKLLQWAYDTKRPKLYALFMTLYHTGRRISEIVGTKPYTDNPGLRPCDIHDDGLIEFSILKKNHIKIRNKNGTLKNAESVRKQRLLKQPVRKLFPVTDQLLEVLKMYAESIDLYPDQRFFPMSRQKADYWIKRAAKEKGISRSNCKVHMHMFRHSFAIHLLKKNPDNPMALITLKDLLDHSNLEMTMTYTQFNPTEKRKVLNNSF